MIGLKRAQALGLALAAGVALAGCVTVFPKVKPAQLYRFGQLPAPAAPAAAGGPPVNVARAGSAFASAASSDRILTFTGAQAAYIAGARWVSPAAVLFDEAEFRAFEAAGGSVRLIGPGQPVQASFSLKLNVETFEARYRDGPGQPPTVEVVVAGELMRLRDRQIVATQLFSIRKRAADNRVGAIVEAFDDATADTLGQLARWTGAQVTAPGAALAVPG